MGKKRAKGKSVVRDLNVTYGETPMAGSGRGSSSIVLQAVHILAEMASRRKNIS
jgi:hypothetical protein